MLKYYGESKLKIVVIFGKLLLLPREERDLRLDLDLLEELESRIIRVFRLRSTSGASLATNLYLLGDPFIS
jgi:hypothetical protein